MTASSRQEFTVAAAAKELDGIQYGEQRPEFWKKLLQHRFVAVSGYSDDVMEMVGAITDEFGMKAYLTKHGILSNQCENDDCPYHREEKQFAVPIEAKFGAPWTFQTEIPHQTFKMMEGDDVYAIGIVFSLDDVP